MIAIFSPSTSRDGSVMWSGLARDRERTERGWPVVWEGRGIRRGRTGPVTRDCPHWHHVSWPVSRVRSVPHQDSGDHVICVAPPHLSQPVSDNWDKIEKELYSKFPHDTTQTSSSEEQLVFDNLHASLNVEEESEVIQIKLAFVCS